MPPTVSVVIPTFNRSQLLLRALNSVFAQTYPDYEIIIVDDGSTDDTRPALVPYIEKIRYSYQPNRGVSAARNQGIKLAEGEWIAFLDSDDEWMPRKLEAQLKSLKQFPACDACFTDGFFSGNPEMRDSCFVRAGFRPNSQSGNSKFGMGLFDKPARDVLTARYPAIHLQSLMVRHSSLDQIGWFDENMIVAEDTDFIARLVAKTKLCFVSEVLVTIDRTPQRQVGLMEVFRQNEDKGFSSKCYMYQKWLEAPLLTDPEAIDFIKRELFHGTYYNWITTQLHQHRWRDAFRNVQRFSTITGISRFTVLRMLGQRAVQKIIATWIEHGKP